MSFRKPQTTNHNGSTEELFYFHQKFNESAQLGGNKRLGLVGKTRRESEKLEKLAKKLTQEQNLLLTAYINWMRIVSAQVYTATTPNRHIAINEVMSLSVPLHFLA